MELRLNLQTPHNRTTEHFLCTAALNHQLSVSGLDTRLSVQNQTRPDCERGSVCSVSPRSVCLQAGGSSLKHHSHIRRPESAGRRQQSEAPLTDQETRVCRPEAAV
ncbi:hypothetical protein WMY93_019608 [Mugilogobius chulae]|uniref:Uncharacterized protein n=1 Tax=Mugilogobius chulae TaxID=88201 RepID=A0AAW0NEQ9_9GOBI